MTKKLDRLREQAERCLRLAQAAFGEKLTDELRLIAAEYVDAALKIEGEPNGEDE